MSQKVSPLQSKRIMYENGRSIMMMLTLIEIIIVAVDVASVGNVLIMIEIIEIQMDQVQLGKYTPDGKSYFLYHQCSS